MKAHFTAHTLQFKIPSGTSRGVLTEKNLWIVHIEDELGKKGKGECSVIPGLSPDFNDKTRYETKLQEVCENIVKYKDNLQLLENFPSILFGLESALLNLSFNEENVYFINDFTLGNSKIPINGLVWMGSKDFMLEQVKNKLDAGFKCIKMKIGAIDFEEEISILSSIRSNYSSEQIELRLDANGAFSGQEALGKLKILSQFEIHSIEQPIAPNQYASMMDICDSSPIPIALDEELIGVHSKEDKYKLLNTIQPQYIILKPSLHGGIAGCKEWISAAEENSIKWWMTSALESNIGLECIAQFAASFNNPLPQGLGTGALYTENFPSPLQVENGFIFRR